MGLCIGRGRGGAGASGGDSGGRRRAVVSCELVVRVFETRVAHNSRLITHDCRHTWEICDEWHGFGSEDGAGVSDGGACFDERPADAEKCAACDGRDPGEARRAWWRRCRTGRSCARRASRFAGIRCGIWISILSSSSGTARPPAEWCTGRGMRKRRGRLLSGW